MRLHVERDFKIWKAIVRDMERKDTWKRDMEMDFDFFLKKTPKETSNAT